MKIDIPDFENTRVLVVGDLMLDRYWHGDAARISPEAPVPIVHVKKMKDRAGGAANVAYNIKALGGKKLMLLGIVGEDDAATQLENLLKQKNIDCHLLRVKGFPTVTKLRVIGRNQQLIRLDFEEGFWQVDCKELITVYKSCLPFTDIIVLSDYAKGTLGCCAELIKLANECGIPTLVDPKNKDFNAYRGATLIKPNLQEFEDVVGKCNSEEDLVKKAYKILDEYDFSAILVTRGAQGMSLIAKDKNTDPLHIPTRAREVYDVTGAGDTVIATLATALAAGMDLVDAVILANAAAGVVVRKLGAATISPAELRRAMQRQQDPWAAILTEQQLLQQVEDARENGERIVFTNGCFDILHSGHITYLEHARAFGHRLIVAVNDDASVVRLKGPTRPINALQQRMLVLAAMRSVDWVVSFSEDTPERLIQAVKPDVLVKGGDYKLEEIIGSSFVLGYGGEVHVIPFVDGFSTSSMIDKIYTKSREHKK